MDQNESIRGAQQLRVDLLGAADTRALVAKVDLLLKAVETLRSEVREVVEELDSKSGRQEGVPASKRYDWTRCPTISRDIESSAKPRASMPRSSRRGVLLMLMRRYPCGQAPRRHGMPPGGEICSRRRRFSIMFRVKRDGIRTPECRHDGMVQSSGAGRGGGYA